MESNTHSFQGFRLHKRISLEALSNKQTKLMPHNVHLFIILPDTDECTTLGASACGANAYCLNVPGSFLCLCSDGFTGNGADGCTRE